MFFQCLPREKVFFLMMFNEVMISFLLLPSTKMNRLLFVDITAIVWVFEFFFRTKFLNRPLCRFVTSENVYPSNSSLLGKVASFRIGRRTNRQKRSEEIHDGIIRNIFFYTLVSVIIFKIHICSPRHYIFMSSRSHDEKWFICSKIRSRQLFPLS